MHTQPDPTHALMYRKRRKGEAPDTNEDANIHRQTYIYIYIYKGEYIPGFEPD